MEYQNLYIEVECPIREIDGCPEPDVILLFRTTAFMINKTIGCQASPVLRDIFSDPFLTTKYTFVQRKQYPVIDLTVLGIEDERGACIIFEMLMRSPFPYAIPHMHSEQYISARNIANKLKIDIEIDLTVIHS